MKVVIFSIDNSLPSDNEYRKSNLLVLGEELTDDINGSVGTG